MLKIDTTEDNRGPAGIDAVGAIMDIKRRNKENEHLWNTAQKQMSEDLHRLVCDAFVHQGGRVYPPNFRETMIVVKVDNYRVRYLRDPAYVILESFCESNGILAKAPGNKDVLKFHIGQTASQKQLCKSSKATKPTLTKAQILRNKQQNKSHKKTVNKQ